MVVLVNQHHQGATFPFHLSYFQSWVLGTIWCCGCLYRQHLFKTDGGSRPGHWAGSSQRSDDSQFQKSLCLETIIKCGGFFSLCDTYIQPGSVTRYFFHKRTLSYSSKCELYFKLHESCICAQVTLSIIQSGHTDHTVIESPSSLGQRWKPLGQVTSCC